jgi:hypothetical protein
MHLIPPSYHRCSRNSDCLHDLVLSQEILDSLCGLRQSSVVPLHKLKEACLRWLAWRTAGVVHFASDTPPATNHICTYFNPSLRTTSNILCIATYTTRDDAEPLERRTPWLLIEDYRAHGVSGLPQTF